MPVLQRSVEAEAAAWQWSKPPPPGITSQRCGRVRISGSEMSAPKSTRRSWNTFSVKKNWTTDVQSVKLDLRWSTLQRREFTFQPATRTTASPPSSVMETSVGASSRTAKWSRTQRRTRNCLSTASPSERNTLRLPNARKKPRPNLGSVQSAIRTDIIPSFSAWTPGTAGARRPPEKWFPKRFIRRTLQRSLTVIDTEDCTTIVLGNPERFLILGTIVDSSSATIQTSSLATAPWGPSILQGRTTFVWRRELNPKEKFIPVT